MTGEKQGDVWNKCSQELVNSAKAHVECIGAHMLMEAFKKAVNEYSELIPMLQKLLVLYFYQRILANAVDFIMVC